MREPLPPTRACGFSEQLAHRGRTPHTPVATEKETASIHMTPAQFLNKESALQALVCRWEEARGHFASHSRADANFQLQQDPRQLPVTETVNCRTSIGQQGFGALTV